MFLEAQGVTLTENVLYQDNQSAIKIEQNGKISSGQKTKHMDARYFFIKDRINSEGIKIEYCPTEKMIADFLTKPLQGSKFRQFRDVILGHKHVDTLNESAENSTSQERVKKNISGTSKNGADRDTSAEYIQDTLTENRNDVERGRTDGTNHDRTIKRKEYETNERQVSFFLDNPN
jgi:hypothetical protein